MRNVFIQDEIINYNGDQLCSLFNYKKTLHLGDSIVAFFGEMDVTPEHMVDVEDVIAKDFIYSPMAVNFIIELFDISLEATILYQRAFMNIIEEVLNTFKVFAHTSYTVTLDGDDIFLSIDDKPEGKLSVSIATVSHVSGLIHTGLNMQLNSKVPVLASCLSDIFKESTYTDFINVVLSKFTDYVEDIKRCKYKVFGV